MAAWKLPPIAKVYEALSAVADGRVTLAGSTAARVASSSRDKTYTVAWSADLREITSNDNASLWQGYLGYPIIAVLLALKKIAYNEEVARWLAGVPWKEINNRFKRDYDKAVAHVLHKVESSGGDREAIVREVERIFARLGPLDLQRPEKRTRPHSSSPAETKPGRRR